MDDAGIVTVGVTDLADARVASLADAGMAFPINHRCGIPGRCWDVTVGVTDLADAGMTFPADHAGVFAIGVASLAHAGLVTVGVTDLADAGAGFLAAPADIVDGGVTAWYVPAQMETGDLPVIKGGVILDDSFINSSEYDSGVMSCGDRVSPAVWCRERTQIRNTLDCQHVNYVSCGPVGRGCAEPADGCTSSFGT